ncbi:NAD(P)-dependent oxidoreductase [Ideonella sp. BN130291]|uniref:NAD(P)-dependent oxidoreductase n=1 Tax=Ideonella sp. BN130291 TaxID=3112940 RepID=UPI002E25D530|nr:NAD(P)-dependent oxidoreductase [Ideonella sp. BN130291]
MSVLIVEPLDAEVMGWLAERHPVRYAPELAREPREFRQALFNVRALVLPPSVTLDSQALHYAPVLKAVGRVSAGAENIDLEACTRAGVEVVRSLNATAQAEAEFMIGALLAMLRRVPVRSEDGLLVGRELSSATVGLIGMAQAARSMAELLQPFGSRLIGYDPAVHASDGLWARWGVDPVGLRELLERSDAVCVQLPYFTRYHGLLGERFLQHCKPNQVMVSIAPSALFDEAALAKVLDSGRMAAAWFDSLEPGTLDPGRPLHDIDTLQITPRVASTTRESRVRSAWAVARRIDEILTAAAPARNNFRPTAPGGEVDLAAE